MDAMLDIGVLRDDPEGVESRLRRRDPNVSLAPVLSLDGERRELLRQVEELRRRRNEGSEEVARLRAMDAAAAEAKIIELRGVAEELRALEARLGEVEAALRAELLSLPNIPHDSVPSGAKEEKVVLRQGGEPPAFDFPPRHHLALARDLGLLDMERGVKLAGPRFPMYTGQGARLELMLIDWMFQLHVREHGYIPILPPALANRTSFLVSGQLPKFEEDLYHCERDDLYLNPTAESLLANLHRDEILREEDLPLRYVAYTPCFRREAGTYGEAERGLIRVHQFNKVELFHYTTPERSYHDLEELVGHAEQVLQLLGLHYRVTLLTAQDLAQQSAKTIDLEVWLPAQGGYYEVSSCSNCEAYQARRGNIRFRAALGGKPRFVHTLNGSGLATSRLFAALLEQNQRQDGSVVLPPLLAELLGENVLAT
jgi:seryl-tRNA synthetase